MAQLLLVSSSRTHGSGFLEHCRTAMIRHFQDVKSVAFIPYALADHDGYEQTVRRAFSSLGIQLKSVHHASDPAPLIAQASALFVGGGNSFRLLKSLYDLKLIELIRTKVLANELTYMGSSAGTNLACPTIRTTNDMPIVEPPSLSALGLIPFQINPHFLDPVPNSTHQGETREQRLTEYLEENTVPVLGLREGCWLTVSGNACRLEGNQGARLFCRGEAAMEIAAPADLSHLLAPEFSSRPRDL